MNPKEKSNTNIIVEITYTCRPPRPVQSDTTGMLLEEALNRREPVDDSHNIVISDIAVGGKNPTPLSKIFCFKHMRFAEFNGMSRLAG